MRFVTPLAGMAGEHQVRAAWAVLEEVEAECTFTVLRPLRGEADLHPVMLQIVVDGQLGVYGDPQGLEEVEAAAQLAQLGWRFVR